MSIKNEPKIKNPLIVAIREQLEHRALWMYLLCDEAKKKGLNPEEYRWKRYYGMAYELACKSRRWSKSERFEENIILKTCSVGI